MNCIYCASPRAPNLYVCNYHAELNRAKMRREALKEISRMQLRSGQGTLWEAIPTPSDDALRSLREYNLRLRHQSRA